MPIPHLTWLLSLTHLWNPRPNLVHILPLTHDLTGHTDSYISLNKPETKVFPDFHLPISQKNRTQEYNISEIPQKEGKITDQVNIIETSRSPVGNNNEKPT